MGPLTVMLRFCRADWAPALLESVAFTVKLDVPLGPVGVPVMRPDEFMLNPVARLPSLTVSITDGIAFGFISYVLLSAAAGRYRKLHWLMVVFTVLFVIRYAAM